VIAQHSIATPTYSVTEELSTSGGSSSVAYRASKVQRLRELESENAKLKLADGHPYMDARKSVLRVKLLLFRIGMRRCGSSSANSICRYVEHDVLWGSPAIAHGLQRGQAS
jgi:hypothetical protein